MSEFVFTTTHEIFWSTREPVPIGEVIETLQALERIVRMCPKVLEGITLIDIDHIGVYVDAVESGSLTDKIIIKLFFKDEESFDAFLDKIGEKVRGMPRSVLIGAVIAAIVGYGAWLAAKVGNQAGQTTIANNNTTIINLGAGQVDMTPETFRAIVETAITDKKALATNAVKLFKPARSDGQASIVIDGNTSTTFPPEVIAATPRLAEVDRQERVEDLSDVDLQIRAMDMDSPNKGWAALIPGRVDRRVKLKLDPRVKTTDVAGRFAVRADVSVYYKIDRSGRKMIPDYILLKEIIKD